MILQALVVEVRQLQKDLQTTNGCDLAQPEKCLIRGDSWMFAPEAEYERHGDVQDVVFPCGYTLGSEGTPSISTMVPPIRALRWRTGVFAVFWPGWTSMVIRNNLTTVGYASNRLVLLPAHSSLVWRSSR